MGEKPADLPVSIRLSFEDSAALAVVTGEVSPEASAGFPPYCDNSSTTLPASDLEQVDGQMDQNNDTDAGETSKDRLLPTSVRVTKAEKEWIDAVRGDLSISDYFRSLVQASYAATPELPKRRRREPVKDQAELARALALLGRSRLFSNLAQATEHLNKGTWFPDTDTEVQIRRELEEMRTLRQHLLAALGKEPST